MDICPHEKKSIMINKQIEYDMEREWAYLETWDCR